MSIKDRLRAIERRIVTPLLPRELKRRFIIGDKFVPQGPGGKILLGYGEHEDAGLIVKVVKTEGGAPIPGWPESDPDFPGARGPFGDAKEQARFRRIVNQDDGEAEPGNGNGEATTDK